MSFQMRWCVQSEAFLFSCFLRVTSGISRLTPHTLFRTQHSTARHRKGHETAGSYRHSVCACLSTLRRIQSFGASQTPTLATSQSRPEHSRPVPSRPEPTVCLKRGGGQQSVNAQLHT